MSAKMDFSDRQKLEAYVKEKIARRAILRPRLFQIPAGNSDFKASLEQNAIFTKKVVPKKQNEGTTLSVKPLPALPNISAFKKPRAKTPQSLADSLSRTNTYIFSPKVMSTPYIRQEQNCTSSVGSKSPEFYSPQTSDCDSSVMPKIVNVVVSPAPMNISKVQLLKNTQAIQPAINNIFLPTADMLADAIPILSKDSTERGSKNTGSELTMQNGVTSGQNEISQNLPKSMRESRHCAKSVLENRKSEPKSVPQQASYASQLPKIASKSFRQDNEPCKTQSVIRDSPVVYSSHISKSKTISTSPNEVFVGVANLNSEGSPKPRIRRLIKKSSLLKSPFVEGNPNARGLRSESSNSDYQSEAPVIPDVSPIQKMPRKSSNFRRRSRTEHRFSSVSLISSDDDVDFNNHKQSKIPIRSPPKSTMPKSPVSENSRNCRSEKDLQPIINTPVHRPNCRKSVAKTNISKTKAFNTPVISDEDNFRKSRPSSVKKSQRTTSPSVAQKSVRGKGCTPVTVRDIELPLASARAKKSQSNTKENINHEWNHNNSFRKQSENLHREISHAENLESSDKEVFLRPSLKRLPMKKSKTKASQENATVKGHKLSCSNDSHAMPPPPSCNNVKSRKPKPPIHPNVLAYMDMTSSISQQSQNDRISYQKRKLYSKGCSDLETTPVRQVIPNHSEKENSHLKKSAVKKQNTNVPATRPKALANIQNTEMGLRRSTRTKRPPIMYWKNSDDDSCMFTLNKKNKTYPPRTKKTKIIANSSFDALPSVSDSDNTLAESLATYNSAIKLYSTNDGIEVIHTNTSNSTFVNKGHYEVTSFDLNNDCGYIRIPYNGYLKEPRILETPLRLLITRGSAEIKICDFYLKLSEGDFCCVPKGATYEIVNHERLSCTLQFIR